MYEVPQALTTYRCTILRVGNPLPYSMCLQSRCELNAIAIAKMLYCLEHACTLADIEACLVEAAATLNEN